MTATLVARGLAAGHGDRPLFSGLDLTVGPGDVIGLVGVNGAGKSTLLRMLAGLSMAESGTVAVSPPTATIGYLAQEPDRRPLESVRQFLGRRTGVTAAHDAMQAAAQALASGAPGADDDYSHALDRWLALGGADLDGRAEAVAADLDLDGLARLEAFVQGLRGGTVVVSHDREFLSRTVTRVVELDLAQQQVRTYGGGYAAYLEEREVARRHAREEYDRYAETRAGLEERARSQRAWMEKGVRNARRKQPDHDKVGRGFRIETSEKQAAKARQTERLIERLDVVDEPRKEWELRMTIAAAPRSGTVVASMRGAVVHRGT